MPLTQRIRRMAGGHWIALFALILLAWALLYAMALPSDLRALGRVYGADFWAELCSVTPDAAGFAKLALMWTLMAGAMMAPSFLPALATYDDLPATTRRDFYALLGGYMLVWFGFALLAAAAQIALVRAGVVSPLGDSLSAGFSALLLIGAGLYQFSALKQACLAKCRTPLTFFMQHWRPGRWNAPLMGLRLGAVCLGCCWALMALGFVGGVMNLLWMGAATVLMVLEKLPEIGRHVTRPLGFALIGAGVLMVARAVLVF